MKWVKVGFARPPPSRKIGGRTFAKKTPPRSFSARMMRQASISAACRHPGQPVPQAIPYQRRTAPSDGSHSHDAFPPLRTTHRSFAIRLCSASFQEPQGGERLRAPVDPPPRGSRPWRSVRLPQVLQNQQCPPHRAEPLDAALLSSPSVAVQSAPARVTPASQ